jgi:hypothetical protein
MKIHHHLARKFRESTKAPLWKWLVIILIVVALPLFYTFISVEQIQQVFGNEEQQENSG